MPFVQCRFTGFLRKATFSDYLKTGFCTIYISGGKFIMSTRPEPWVECDPECEVDLSKEAGNNGATVSGTDGGEKIPTGSKLRIGLIVAFLSGVLCACYGLALGFDDDVVKISVKQFGNPEWRAAFAVSALILWGGSVSACGYCVYKFSANKTWSTLTKPGIGQVLLIALAMACLHDGAILLLGVAAPKLGDIGAAIGYAIFMSFAIMVGNVNGFLTGEWKGASKASVKWIIAGIIVLMLGVSVLQKGNNMHAVYEYSLKETAAQTEQEL